MNANKDLWEKGDFTRIADAMRRSGAELVDRIGVSEGEKVLDLGCGDGTTALPAAERGASVVGVDIAANLVAAGNRRAAAAGLDTLKFQEGDASDLAGFPDSSFDRVVTIFGAMFAPRPEAVAREMARVIRAGGTITMGNWIPGDPTLVAQILKVSAAYTPPPPEGFVSPMTWGMEDHVRTRFAAAGIDDVTCEKDSFVFRHDGPPASFVDTFRDYYGPTMNAFAAARESGREEALREELVALFDAQNVSADPGRTEIPATFLRVTAVKPG
jgi:SAM-dependent methyltransferase